MSQAMKKFLFKLLLNNNNLLIRISRKALYVLSLFYSNFVFAQNFNFHRCFTLDKNPIKSKDVNYDFTFSNISLKLMDSILIKNYRLREDGDQLEVEESTVLNKYNINYQHLENYVTHGDSFIIILENMRILWVINLQKETTIKHKLDIDYNILLKTKNGVFIFVDGTRKIKNKVPPLFYSFKSNKIEKLSEMEIDIINSSLSIVNDKTYHTAFEDKLIYLQVKKGILNIIDEKNNLIKLQVNYRDSNIIFWEKFLELSSKNVVLNTNQTLNDMIEYIDSFIVPTNLQMINDSIIVIRFEKFYEGLFEYRFYKINKKLKRLDEYNKITYSRKKDLNNQVIDFNDSLSLQNYYKCIYSNFLIKNNLLFYFGEIPDERCLNIKLREKHKCLRENKSYGIYIMKNSL